MTYFDEDGNRLTRVFYLLLAFLLISFTALDLSDVLPTVSDSLKLAGTALCFLYTVLLLFLYHTDTDRMALMLSMLFAVAADVFLLFTKQYAIGVILFCFVQGFHSIRLLTIKRFVVRMNGRISASYRNYKIWKAVLLQNLIQLVFSAVVLGAAFVLKWDHTWLPAAIFFYASGFAINLTHIFSISHDVRLLDDMKPLRCYALGMLFYFICDLLLAFCRLPGYVSFLSGLAGITKYVYLFVWPFYLIGLALIATSGIRHQNFYS